LLRRRLRSLLFFVYVVIGLVVASGHHYFAYLNSAKPIASAILAVLLWPLVIFGVKLHIK
jgi:phosphotransferase system  glucose/maltose/N-acetylglucosamine-specific IIC component